MWYEPTNAWIQQIINLEFNSLFLDIGVTTISVRIKYAEVL